jgi:hypothetical protein
MGSHRIDRCASRRSGQSAAALATLLISCLVLGQSIAGAQPSHGRRAEVSHHSAGQRIDGSFPDDCVQLGLKPISARLSLFLAGDSAEHIPTLKVLWSAKPLPKGCSGRTVIAVRARARFVKTGRSLEFGSGPAARWRVLWLGRTHVDHAEVHYSGPAVTFNLGCVEKPQAWLRYEVKDRNGRTVAQRVRPVPIISKICER